MLIYLNSFNVLGLQSNVDNKLIYKRYKSINNILKIGEIFISENDISFLNYSEIRNKYNIDIAYNQLSNIKNKFIEMFFWIQNISKEDIDIIGIDSSYFIKKNKLINTFLYLENNKELICSIEDIISDLNGIIKNDDFWEQFIVYFNYYNSDEFSHNDLNELKSEIIGILADYLFDLSSDLGIKDLYLRFERQFKKSTQNFLNNKGFQDRIDFIEKIINNLNIVDIETFDFESFKKDIIRLDQDFLYFEKYSLNHNFLIIKLKDNLSKNIKKIYVNMYNKIGIVKKTLELAEIALQYAQSEVIKDIIAQDIKYFKDNGWKIPDKMEEIEQKKISLDGDNIYRNLIIGETKIGTIVNVGGYKLNIHKGSKVGDTFTIKGKGHKGQNGGTDGDLIFTIKQIDKNPNNKHNDTAIKENSILQENIKIKIDGYNIYRNLIIGETKIGTIVNVGGYKLNIHKGSKVGDTFTIKGKGHKGQNGGTDGDLIFEIKEISKGESTSKQEIINERQDKEINRKIFGMILLLMIMAFIILVSIFN